MRNVPKEDGNLLSEVTAENYVSAIIELRQLLHILNGRKYEYQCKSLIDALYHFKDSELTLPFEYKIERKTAANYTEMNILWKGVYSSAIKHFERFLQISKEIQIEYIQQEKDFDDGNSVQLLVNTYEKNKKLRKECLEKKVILVMFVASILRKFMENSGKISFMFITRYRCRKLKKWV